MFHNLKRIQPWAAACLLAGLLAGGCRKQPEVPATLQEAGAEDRFIGLMNSGKNYLSQREAPKAIENFKAAAKLAPDDPMARLNLANAHLLAGEPALAQAEAGESLRLKPNSAAAHYVRGCALLREGNAAEAAKDLTVSRNLEPGIAAVSHQLGLAHAQLKQWEEAILSFQEVVALEPRHPAAYYQLAQALLRVSRQDEAEPLLAVHQEIATSYAGQMLPADFFERCAHTAARVPFKLEQPEASGVAVTFVDDSEKVFAGRQSQYAGPAGLIDVNHTGWSSLFVLDKEAGFVVLRNEGGVLEAIDEPIPHNPENTYRKALVGDLQNDRFEDVVVLGEKGSHFLRFATNGFMMDVTMATRLPALAATDGALVDLDFTGKLDLLVVTAQTNSVRVFRQLGNLLFRDITATSGVPATVIDAGQLLVEDWNHDDMMDVVVRRSGAPPMALAKLRGGNLTETNSPVDLPAVALLATGDLNNDLRADFVGWADGKILVRLEGLKELSSDLPATVANPRALHLQDFDNDGWLDIWLAGDGIQVWRNAGRAGFIDATARLGLDKLALSGVTELHFADLDHDCDTDIVAVTGAGLRFLRNDGGNVNKQLKVRLFGNRSNASGLGVKLELASGGLRLSRTVTQLPVEIGVGKRDKLETFSVKWFDLEVPTVDLPVDCSTNLLMAELILPTGSCPYLYRWNGEAFEFVTDLLGASPLGLPAAEGVMIEADPTELVRVGTEANMKPLDGYYTLQITEELREILYLDEARLWVVDRPGNSMVESVDKLLPGGPFPATALRAFHSPLPPARATTLEGLDVTAALREIDGARASPARLREPQLRGLAEPHGVVLDFGEVDWSKPRALALNGWLRFGGGMANMAASRHADFPFPFPTLEAENAAGTWSKVDVNLGAPAGKTKTIFADLTGKIPAGTKRLKVAAAFEIHWDSIHLATPAADDFKVAVVEPDSATLGWRGYSAFKDYDWTWPLTPEYEKVNGQANWTITPSGWATSYGEVGPLLHSRDEALCVIAAGDQLTLRFRAGKLPAKPEGFEREFFLYVDGWDKDADFHVAQGYRVEPLPWHGMGYQRYGKEPRPPFPTDGLNEKHNTRWVSPSTAHWPRVGRLERSGPNGR